MIREITNKDKEAANELLKEFNCTVESYKENPFAHILMYDNIGILIYTKIYNRIEIEYIKVSKKRCGIGSQLLNYMVKNNSSIDNITLEVKVSNKEAISFYLKNSFERLAIRSNYYGNEDGVLMIRKFDNNEE